jgi:hypothetical protein
MKSRSTIAFCIACIFPEIDGHLNWAAASSASGVLLMESGSPMTTAGREDAILGLVLPAYLCFWSR